MQSSSRGSGRFVGQALRFPDFRLLAGGQLVSNIGTQMQVVAVAWQIYLLTNSKLALGLIGVARGLPLIVSSLGSGVLADAFDRRKTLIATQLILASTSAFLAALTLAGLISAPAIYLTIGFAAIAQGLDQPSRSALIPSLVSRPALPSALALNVAIREFATVTGPAIGGLVIALAGVTPVYVLDAVSYGFVLAAVLLMRTRVGHVATRQVNLAALTEGWRFILRNRIILSVQGLDFLANFFAASAVLFPVFARTIYHVGPQGLGLLYAAGSAGAVAGALIFGAFSRARRQGAVVLASVAVYGLAIAAFGFAPWFYVGLGFLALSGAADAVSASLRGTISQLATPDRLRGRVTAVNTMFVAGGPQLGNVEAGLLAAAIGTREAVAAGGIATVLITGLVALVSPTVRKYGYAPGGNSPAGTVAVEAEPEAPDMV
ncbi:MAG TPA: MFS transporter [Chloroflexota bacterium]|nr:MFS transporter [Chloroflexota bacterium]